VQSSAAVAERLGTLSLVLPAVVLADRQDIVDGSVLPVLTAHLTRTVESDPLLTKERPILEWLWRDAVLLSMVSNLSREQGEELRLKVRYCAVTSNVMITHSSCKPECHSLGISMCLMYLGWVLQRKYAHADGLPAPGG
jgi:hypothetical protein